MVERARVTVFCHQLPLVHRAAVSRGLRGQPGRHPGDIRLAADFNVDPQRIGLCGDSAGGQLAPRWPGVAPAPELGDDWRRPKLQLLIYPVMQAASLRTESYLTQQAEPFLKPWQMADFISIYLTGSRAASDWLLKHVTAAYQRATGLELQPSMLNEATRRSSQLTRIWPLGSPPPPLTTESPPVAGRRDLEKLDLPPASSWPASSTPLLDDALLYADRLERSEVRVQLTRFSTFHAARWIPKRWQGDSRSSG
uniref:Abhydrolase_3 domain-containing protein n=1 Tax=Macrostomum lignano TaxID=282301 RepID=A0A1I8FFC5_9PLAT